MRLHRSFASLARNLRLLLIMIAGVCAVQTKANEEPRPSADNPEAIASQPAVAAAEENIPHEETVPHDDSGTVAASLLRLAGSLTDRREFAAAEVAYRQVLTQGQFTDFDHRDALIGLGRMYRLQGVTTKAAAIYEKFLKEFPDDHRVPEVLLDLGRTLRAMGAHRLAIARFYSVINSTLKISPAEPDHYQLLARTAQFEIAETHYEAGNFTEAGKFFVRLRLLDLAPADRARAHFKAAYSQKLAGDLETSVLTLQSFLEQWPDDENSPEAAYLLATTLRQLNRLNESLAVTRELLESVKSRSRQNPQLWAYWQRRTGNQLANDFFQNGQIMSALGLYQGLASLSNDPAWLLPVTYQIALCHEKLHFIPSAEEAYQKVIDGIEALGESAPAHLKEFGRMASWRLENLAWFDRTNRQLATFFSTETPAKRHDTIGSTAAAPNPVR